MLTKEQDVASKILWKNERAVVHLIAGAGSGKTTTLMETVARGIESGFPREKICLITFTRKAANEMRRRLAHKNISAGFTGTMHSLGYKIIRECNTTRKRIIRHPEAILMDIVKELFPQFSHIPSRILIRKDFLNAEDLLLLRKKYAEFKNIRRLMDLDDLISQACILLKRNAASFPYSCILVDEFQDTSPDQLDFIRAMPFEKLFVVGDDWQSIYGFRGADVSIALNFQDHFPGSTRLFLTHNFRSQKHIVKLGNRVIRLSSSFIRKKLAAFHRGQKRPVCHIVEGTDDPEKIWKIYDSRYRLSQNRPELTVLVRTNRLRNILINCFPQNVEILTIHASKGMEFENVLVFGIARDIFPHKWNNFDEEVRLLYVAVTRARQRLEFLTWEKDDVYSAFTPFLVRHCRLNYLTTSWHDPAPME